MRQRRVAGQYRLGQMTFTKDIAPIFQEKCQTCHRTGEMAPMPLVTYKQVRPWAKDIRERVAARQMPPWHIDPTVGIQSFQNDISLSSAQIDTIVKWVAAGAPEGDLKDMPPPKQWPEDKGWKLAGQFGPPDLVISSDTYTMPAQGQDAWFRPVTQIRLPNRVGCALSRFGRTPRLDGELRIMLWRCCSRRSPAHIPASSRKAC